jgi:S-adenosylmethionine-diacylgycerolhomoserine-N-methlytransferase
VAHLLPARGTLLEVGCGTGRNLRHVGRHRPDARLFGLDAASVMLRTARRACQRAGVRPTLCRGMAENVRPARFGVEGFDVILCSYLFSMLPQPVQALHAVLCSLKPGAHLVVVDFGTASALPRPLRGLLHRWLHLFGVAHRPSVSTYLHSQRAAGRLQLIRQQHVWGRYAELHVWRRPEQPLAVSAS